MLSLHEIETRFAGALFKPGGGESELTIRTNGLSAARRLQVYRNNVFTSLTGALRACYPVINRLLGERPSRYGADDRLGTLNEITAATVRAASNVVKQGRVIDLGRTLDESIPKFPGRYWHQSVDVSPHLTNLRRADTVGKGWGKNEINWITEIQAGTFQVGTQLDSIGHIQIGDRFYNGWSTRDVVESWGLNRFGMETVPPIVTRGVLVDVAAYRGAERLPRGEVITRADLEGALKRQGIALLPGDAVLIHTGWGGLWGRDNEAFLSGEPGPAWRPSAGSMHSASVSPAPIPGVTDRCLARIPSARSWCRRRCT